MSSLPDLRDLAQPPTKAKGIVHKMIADIAKGMAKEHWQVLAKQNEFYHRYRKARPFVRDYWDRYIPIARATLTGMLGDPKRPENEKEAIFQALLLDGTANPKQMAEPAKPVFTFKA